MRLPTLFIILLCYFVSHNLDAQKAGNPANAKDQPLSEQIDQMVEGSNRYQRFRVVPAEWLAALKVNVQDSLNARASEIGKLQNTITELEATIKEQTTEMNQSTATIEALNKEKDGISFFGTILDKTLYNTIVWGLAAILLAGLIFFLGRSRYAVSVSRTLENSNAELTTELEQAKRRRLEVEQDLRRKLQDERNKQGKS